MADKVLLHIPVLGNRATRSRAASVKNYRFLNSFEKALATTVFGQSIDFDVVRIIVTRINPGYAQTIGNDIRIPPGYVLTKSTLIHELTHVWQNQNHGKSYIASAVLHNTIAGITTGNRNGAYAYKIVPGQPFIQYTSEQQAMIVEDYYSKPALQTNKEYIRLIREVRLARPVSGAIKEYTWELEEYTWKLENYNWGLSF